MLRDVFSFSTLRAGGAVLGALSIAAGAQAGGGNPLGITHTWVEVDNSMLVNGNPSGLNDGSFDGTIYRTFDLFVNLTQTVTAFDSGNAQNDSFGNSGNTGIDATGATMFQFEPLPGTPLDKIPNVGTINAFPLAEYDSWVGIGDAVGTNISTPVPLVFNTTELTGAWFTIGGVPPENGGVFVARFTVSSLLGFGQDESASRFLGGQLLVGTGDGNSTIIDISNAFATTGPPPSIPTPGAIAIFGLAGLASVRRRRG